MAGKFNASCVLMVLLAGTVSGCGPEHAGVTGLVTLDGEPLANATVSFMPVHERGRPSFGRTGDDGRYSLRETGSLTGAVPGKYTVRITTYVDGNPDADPPIPAVPETVPAKYNLETTLTAEVHPGENTLDFRLDSKGKILQPKLTY